MHLPTSIHSKAKKFSKAWTPFLLKVDVLLKKLRSGGIEKKAGVKHLSTATV